MYASKSKQSTVKVVELPARSHAARIFISIQLQIDVSRLTLFEFCLVRLLAYYWGWFGFNDWTIWPALCQWNLQSVTHHNIVVLT